MNGKLNLRKAILTLLASLLLVISCVAVVWATCFETPIAQTPQSKCDGLYDYYEYAPDPPLNCGVTTNPFEGCQKATQPEYRWDYHYDELDCGGQIKGVTQGYDGNKVEFDTAYVCCE